MLLVIKQTVDADPMHRVVEDKRCYHTVTLNRGLKDIVETLARSKKQAICICYALALGEVVDYIHKTVPISAIKSN
jgi:hypothetical protein